MPDQAMHTGIWRRVWQQFDANTRDHLGLTPQNAAIKDEALHALVGPAEDVHKVVLAYDQQADAFRVTVGKPSYRRPHWTVRAAADGVDIEALRETIVQLCAEAGV